jgi:hypothetical protein
MKKKLHEFVFCSGKGLYSAFYENILTTTRNFEKQIRLQIFFLFYVKPLRDLHSEELSSDSSFPYLLALLPIFGPTSRRQECALENNLESILPNFFLRKMNIFSVFVVKLKCFCSMRKYCLFFEMAMLNSKNQKNKEIKVW